MIHDVNQTILESSQAFSINYVRQSILLNIGSDVAILQKNCKDLSTYVYQLSEFVLIL